MFFENENIVFLKISNIIDHYILQNIPPFSQQDVHLKFLFYSELYQSAYKVIPKMIRKEFYSQ